MSAGVKVYRLFGAGSPFERGLIYGNDGIAGAFVCVGHLASGVAIFQDAVRPLDTQIYYETNWKGWFRVQQKWVEVENTRIDENAVERAKP